MPQHLIEVYAPKEGNILAGERYARIGMPVDSTREQMLAAGSAAEAAVLQMLGRFGIRPQLKVVVIPNTPTDEEMIAIQEGLADGSIPTISHEELMASLEFPG